jgi:hypothetical protein
MNQVKNHFPYFAGEGEVKSITPYRSQIRRPLVWLVKRETVTPISSPAEGAPARELESTDSDSRSDAFALAA